MLVLVGVGSGAAVRYGVGAPVRSSVDLTWGRAMMSACSFRAMSQSGGRPSSSNGSEDLAALAEGLATVTESSRGRLVLVRGEAGIGKTALLSRFCQEVGRSVRILWTACDPLFTPRPLGPLLDIARETDGELRARVESGAEVSAGSPGGLA